MRYGRYTKTEAYAGTARGLKSAPVSPAEDVRLATEESGEESARAPRCGTLFTAAAALGDRHPGEGLLDVLAAARPGGLGAARACHS